MGKRILGDGFNGRLRDELLLLEIFETLAEASYLVDRWRLHYNHRRPQLAPGMLTLRNFAELSQRSTGH